MMTQICSIYSNTNSKSRKKIKVTTIIFTTSLFIDEVNKAKIKR